MTETELLQKYVSVGPNNRQLIIQDMKFYAFVHYGVNTFTNREWGNGKEPESIFNPKSQNTDQWCAAIKDAGMKGVILTCKHHDGFCLWQTKTTEHCIRNSPYKNGKGDVVKEVSESCKKYGLKFGVYLSPWDRNSKLYGTPKYNDMYIEQEKELLTGYGDIFMLWLDGACGANADGQPKQEYDFERIWNTAVELQPDICMSGCAPDVRWIGNESGVTRESEWNVVPEFKYDQQNLAVNCQDTADCKKFQKRCVDVMTRDLGSREFLKNYDELMWYPAEVDVSIRKGWFYHKIEDFFTVKSVKKLMSIYYNSVGGNSLMLLNIPPDKNGLLAKKDVSVLHKMGEELRKIESLRIKDLKVSEIKTTDRGYEFTMEFPECSVDRIRMEEDTVFSQRVESFKVFSLINGKEQNIYNGTVIGFGKIAMFEPVVTSKLKILITKCRFEPHIKIAEVYKRGGYRI